MCCRYYIDRDDDELAEIIETAAKSALAEKSGWQRKNRRQASDPTGRIFSDLAVRAVPV